MLPYLAFAGPVTVMMALLNAQGRFALTAFSPLLFNIALIAVMAVLLASRSDAVLAAQILAATVGVAGLLQLSILVLRRGGNIATPLRVSFDAEIRGFLGKAIPGMIASSTPQLLMVAGAIVASSSPSAVSWLYFANRLVELPLGIVGVAMGTVLIPEMTRALRGGDQAAVAHAESRGLELAVGLALPAMLGLIVLSEPVVRMLFEHGAFTSADTAATSRALMWLALGLPANVLVKALSPAFFAREDTLTPLLATLKGVVFAIVLSVLLGHWFGASGIAASLAIGAWSTAFSLIRRGGETFGFSIDAAARRRLPGILAAALAMGAALWLATRFTPALAPGAHGLVQAIVLLLLIIAGIAIYGLFLRLFGIAGWRETVNAIRQNQPARLARLSLKWQTSAPNRQFAGSITMAMVERVFSGVQPTGNLHLGNYLGAFVNFVKLQETHNCIYCVVDMHAITQGVDVWGGPAELARCTREVTAAFIASGIDPKKHIVFNQSQVTGHAELAWIFNCVARMGWLNRMTQFKDKAGKDREAASVGLYDYPVLMAADILVYRATHVPVGEDQKQHLELSRDIAQKFNNDFADSIRGHGFNDGLFFPLPEPVITGPATRVMSLRDGTKKMSKSDSSDNSRINLTDDAETIAAKIRKAKTDPEPLPSEEKGLEGRPEADNLVGIYAGAVRPQQGPGAGRVRRRAVLQLQERAGGTLRHQTRADRLGNETAGRQPRPCRFDPDRRRRARRGDRH